MLFPDSRPRRLRQSDALRRMVRETTLSIDDLILPLFAIDGKGVKNPINSMPGHYQLSIDNLVKTSKEAYALGIPAIILFGIPEKKDPLATTAYDKNGIVQRAVRALKDKVPDLMVITDVCLCQYTDHGHCGIVERHTVDNDATSGYGCAVRYDGRACRGNSQYAGRQRLHPSSHYVICREILLGILRTVP